MTSAYVACLEAANLLLDDPSARPITDGPEGIFTELDVIMLAARRATTGFTSKQRVDWMNDAGRDASQAMGLLWRTSRAVRYGPVHVPDVERPDYMRVASKIAYAHPDGPRRIVTPNGTFPKIFVKDDPAKGPGRRHGADRDDLTPWSDQHGAPAGSLKAANARLKAELRDLREQLSDALTKMEIERAENARLRNQTVTRDEVREMIRES